MLTSVVRTDLFDAVAMRRTLDGFHPPLTLCKFRESRIRDSFAIATRPGRAVRYLDFDVVAALGEP